MDRENGRGQVLDEGLQLPKNARHQRHPIAVIDGFKGVPEALGTVFPATTLQTCIAHLILNSLDFASWKERKLLAAAIKPIYTAASADVAQAEFDAFEQGPWGQVSDSRGRLAPRLGPRDPVLCVPAGSTPDV